MIRKSQDPQVDTKKSNAIDSTDLEQIRKNIAKGKSIGSLNESETFKLGIKL